jgi:hypothetical protein
MLLSSKEMAQVNVLFEGENRPPKVDLRKIKDGGLESKNLLLARVECLQNRARGRKVRHFGDMMKDEGIDLRDCLFMRPHGRKVRRPYLVVEGDCLREITCPLVRKSTQERTKCRRRRIYWQFRTQLPPPVRRTFVLCQDKLSGFYRHRR